MQDVVIEHEEELGHLDAIAGDGDHGIGMRRGVDAAVAAAEQALGGEGGASPSRVLTAAGEAWSERAGGTSGRAVGIGGHRRGPRAGQPGVVLAPRTRPPP